MTHTVVLLSGFVVLVFRSAFLMGMVATLPLATFQYGREAFAVWVVGVAAFGCSIVLETRQTAG